MGVNTLTAFVCVGIGGALGSAARYATSIAFSKAQSPVFPVSTLFINLLGSLAIGFLCGLAAKHTWFGRELGLVLITGLCGGFTTFSAFSWENSNLLLSGNALTAVGYTLLSVVMGIALCRVGFWLSHYT